MQIIFPYTLASAFSASNLLSGAIGAIVASAISWTASYFMERNNKQWALQAEFRRHRVSRLVVANDGLRTSFFLAITQLEYHLLALDGLEADERRPTMGASYYEEVNRRWLQELERYNKQIGKTEAIARAHASFLDDELVPVGLRAEIQQLLAELISSITTDAASVRLRIALFHEKTLEVLRLLNSVDRLIGNEIKRPLT